MNPSLPVSSMRGRRSSLRGRAALLAIPLAGLALTACLVPGEGEENDSEVDFASLPMSSRDVGHAIANPNEQFSTRWLLDNNSSLAGQVEFSSPISTPDGRLVVSHVLQGGERFSNNFALAVVKAPSAAGPDYNAGTVAPHFGDNLLVRDGAGNVVLTPIEAPTGGYVWQGNTNDQMAVGSDVRLAGGVGIRVLTTTADPTGEAQTKCFQLPTSATTPDTSPTAAEFDPSSVPASPTGRYECRRYLLFMPGKPSTLPGGAAGGTMPENLVHVAWFGVVLDAYPTADPLARAAAPSIVKARFLSGFHPLLGSPTGPRLSSGIELSVTADSRLLIAKSGDFMRFTFSETPWDSTTWEPTRSLTCLATPTSTRCPGEPAAPTPGLNGIADKAICTAGRSVDGVCNGSTMELRRKYPVAAYPIRNPSGTFYQGELQIGTNPKVTKPDGFAGGYGWVSFDGSDFIYNASRRSVRAIFGKNTRGFIKHIDTQANVTSARYCVGDPIAGNNTVVDESIDQPPNNPHWYSLGYTNGVGDRYYKDDKVNGKCRAGDGARQLLPFGTGTGMWRFFPEVSDPLLPMSRRSPLYMLLDHNQLLGNFGPVGAPKLNQSVNDGEYRYRHLYNEVALDDFADGDYVAYYHMNEQILDNTDRETVFALNGAGTSGATLTPDTSGNSYSASLVGGAQLPIEHTGLQDQGGGVNTGYLGRGLFLPAGGSATVQATTGPLLDSLEAFTAELAFNASSTALWTQGTATPLLEMPGFWKLSVTSAPAGFYPTLTMYKSPAAGGAAITVGNAAAALPKVTSKWTHIAVTVDLSSSGDRKARFYVNGALMFTSNAMPSSMVTKVAASPSSSLVMGPHGQGSAGASYKLDEVAISRRARDAETIAAAAFAVPNVDFDYMMSTSSIGPKLFSDSGVLPITMRGLSAADLRIPASFLTKVQAVKSANETLKARFEKIRDLGAALFQDDLLTVKPGAASNTYVESKGGRSCATCHVLAQALAHQSVPFDTDINALPQNLPVNTPTVINRAFGRRQFLDQRSESLVDQVLRPIENVTVLEMGGDATAIASFIASGVAGTSNPAVAAADGFPANITPPNNMVGSYLAWFQYAFGSGPGDASVTVDRTLLAHALTAFLVAQVRGNSVVDRLRAGVTLAAGIDVEKLKRGLRLFEGKARCVACHSGSNYSDEMMHMSGSFDLPNNPPVTTKTPSLRNVSLTAPYFRKGTKGSLADVIDHYNAGGCLKTDPRAAAGAQVTCDPELYPLGLTETEKTDLVAFLSAL